MYPDDILKAAESLIAACQAAGIKMATAESCTGGLIGGALTAISGSSTVFERGFLTYSNEAKTEVLGVPADLIATHGAVSEPVARAMAEGALAHAPVGLAVAVTGIAGTGEGALHEVHLFPGDRDAVRMATVAAALKLAHEMLA
jgi:nicotinamide-nucleotide amidase